MREMISENLTTALSDQINAEMYSSYLYLAMSAYAEDAGLKGAANWLYVQTREEMAHAIHMYQYLLDRGAVPGLFAIEQPPACFESLKDLFEKVYAHEQKVTERINNIASIALRENDHACYQFIMWYVNEQVEEESNVTDILAKLDLIGDSRPHLLNLDKEFAARVFNNPFPNDAKLNGSAAAV